MTPLEETIKTNLELLNNGSLDDKRSVVCRFYRDGEKKCVTCEYCLSPDDQVEKCSKLYAEYIRIDPVASYYVGFGKRRKREKIKFEDLSYEVGMYCDRCHINHVCPMMEPSSQCGIDFGAEGKPLNDVMDELIKLQQARIKKLVTFENVAGGMPDMNTSAEMDRLTRLINVKSSLNNPTMRISTTIEASGTALPTAASGGILSKIFGSTDKNTSTQNVEVKEVTGDVQ